MKCENLKINEHKKFYSEKALLNFFNSKSPGIPFSRAILNLKNGQVALITAKNGSSVKLDEVPNIPYVGAKKIGKRIIAKTIKLENGKTGVAVAIIKNKPKK